MDFPTTASFCFRGFLETNKDTLFNDVVAVCSTASSRDAFLNELFTDKRTADEKRHRQCVFFDWRDILPNRFTHS